MNRSDVKNRVKRLLQQGAGAASIPETSRAQLLALAELARRVGGEIPTNGTVLDLALYELRVFSQNGEDGVLAEIVRRSGAPGRFFVEFGAFDGVENNCVVLADVLGWDGLYIEGGRERFEGLERKYGSIDRVRTAKAMVTPENIEDLFARHGVPSEPDVLSIDVDGIDYWIWEALESYRPRIVVVEYNGQLGAERRLVVPREHPGWDGKSNWYGASIAAYETLAASKGYRLVHCDLTGNNAFFVREDLPGEYVPAAEVPRRAANHALLGNHHQPDPLGRPFIDLDA